MFLHYLFDQSNVEYVMGWSTVARLASKKSYSLLRLLFLFFVFYFFPFG